MSLRSLFCLFLNGHFTPVLLYCVFIDNTDDFYEDLDKESKEEDKQTVKDKDSTSDKDKNKAKKKIAQQVVSRDYVDYDEEDSSGHFMAFFLTATVLCVAGYVIFHNKQKVMMAHSSLIYNSNPNHASIFFALKGAQWLSGRVLELRSRDCRFEPQRRQCIVSLIEQDTLFSA